MKGVTHVSLYCYCCKFGGGYIAKDSIRGDNILSSQFLFAKVKSWAFGKVLDCPFHYLSFKLTIHCP